MEPLMVRFVVCLQSVPVGYLEPGTTIHSAELRHVRTYLCPRRRSVFSVPGYGRITSTEDHPAVVTHPEVHIPGVIDMDIAVVTRIPRRLYRTPELNMIGTELRCIVTAAEFIKS